MNLIFAVLYDIQDIIFYMNDIWRPYYLTSLELYILPAVLKRSTSEKHPFLHKYPSSDEEGGIREEHMKSW